MSACGREPADVPATPAPTDPPAAAAATDAAPDRRPSLADLPPAPPPATDRFRLKDYEVVVLANGARAVLMEKRDVPLIAFQATIAGGVVAEPAARNGVAALTAALLAQGAGERDAAAFAEAVAAVGGEFEADAGLEALVVKGEFMARDAELMIGLLADALQRPHLEPAEFEKLRTRAVNSLIAARDADLRSLILPYANAWVHGDHPYGRALTGDEESLGRVSLDDVRAFYADQVGADRLTVVLVGDFDADEMAARLTRAFGEWRGAGAALPEAPPTISAKGGRVLLVDKPGATQSYFWIGNLGAARGDAETPAIDLVNTLFGGRFTSMLNNALRVESGLSYGARSLLERHSREGSLGMFSFCATADTRAAMDLALSQLERLHDPGFDAETLSSGRNYILGTWTLALETGPQLAGAVSELQFYGLPDSALNDYARRVAAVSAEETEAVIERVFPSMDALVFVVIGDGDLIREELAAYGELTEIAISAPRFGP
jgi:predicted Zn-dependent peptidase